MTLTWTPSVHTLGALVMLGLLAAYLASQEWELSTDSSCEAGCAVALLCVPQDVELGAVLEAGAVLWPLLSAKVESCR